MKSPFFVIIVCALAACTTVPPSGNNTGTEEKLVQAMPAGYKVGFQNRQGDVLTTEMIPASQQIESWKEMITAQIFYGGVPQKTPTGFFNAMDAGLKQRCYVSVNNIVEKGIDNGYPFAVWQQSCRIRTRNGQTTEEWAWVKAIQGDRNFYVVQKASKSRPGPLEMIVWTDYLKSIQVCNPGIANRPCPPTSENKEVDLPRFRGHRLKQLS